MTRVVPSTYMLYDEGVIPMPYRVGAETGCSASNGSSEPNFCTATYRTLSDPGGPWIKASVSTPAWQAIHQRMLHRMACRPVLQSNIARQLTGDSSRCDTSEIPRSVPKPRRYVDNISTEQIPSAWAQFGKKKTGAVFDSLCDFPSRSNGLSQWIGEGVNGVMRPFYSRTTSSRQAGIIPYYDLGTIKILRAPFQIRISDDQSGTVARTNKRSLISTNEPTPAHNNHVLGMDSKSVSKIFSLELLINRMVFNNNVPKHREKFCCVVFRD